MQVLAAIKIRISLKSNNIHSNTFFVFLVILLISAKHIVNNKKATWY